jgi:general stress protein CsbA
MSAALSSGTSGGAATAIQNRICDRTTFGYGGAFAATMKGHHMANLDISPDGDTDIGFVNIAGTDYVRIFLNDVDGTDSASLTYTTAHFVALADHFKMVADQLVAGNVKFPRI